MPREKLHRFDKTPPLGHTLLAVAERLPDSDVGWLFKAALARHRGEEVERPIPPNVELIWETLVEPEIEALREHCESVSAARAAAGRIGGTAARNKPEQAGTSGAEANEANGSKTKQTEAKPGKAEQLEANEASKAKADSERERRERRDLKAQRSDPSRPPARDAPAQAREAGGTPPGPPTPRREISFPVSQSPETPTPADDDEPFPDEEPPGTPEERSAARAAIAMALGGGSPFPDRRGQPVSDEWEWRVRDPVEAVVATYGKGKWGAYRAALGTDRFRDIAETYWRECRAGEHADARNHAALLTNEFKAALQAGNGGAK